MTLTIKKYDSKKVYVVVNWIGDFQYPREVDHRNYTDVFEFDHIPTEQDIKTKLEDSQSIIMKRSDWSNIKIIGYSILPQMKSTDIILK